MISNRLKCTLSSASHVQNTFTYLSGLLPFRFPWQIFFTICSSVEFWLCRTYALISTHEEKNFSLLYYMDRYNVVSGRTVKESYRGYSFSIWDIENYLLFKFFLLCFVLISIKFSHLFSKYPEDSIFKSRKINYSNLNNFLLSSLESDWQKEITILLQWKKYRSWLEERKCRITIIDI